MVRPTASHRAGHPGQHLCVDRSQRQRELARCPCDVELHPARLGHGRHHTAPRQNPSLLAWKVDSDTRTRRHFPPWGSATDFVRRRVACALAERKISASSGACGTADPAAWTSVCLRGVMN